MGDPQTAALSWRSAGALAFALLVAALAMLVTGVTPAPAGDSAPTSGEPDRLDCDTYKRLKRVRSLDIGEGLTPWGPTRRAAGAIARYGYAHPNSWAEMYLYRAPDDERDRPPTWVGVSFSRHLTLHATRIRELIEPGVAVRFFKAKSSAEELSAVQRRIAGQMGAQVGGGDPPFDPGGDYEGNDMNVYKNTVEVLFAEPTRSLARKIRDRFGPTTCVDY